MNHLISPLKINPSRFLKDFQALAAIGATPDGGVHRPAFSEAHLAAREWLRGRVLSAGLEWRVDPVGNCSALLRSAAPGAKTLLLGSHLDSVPYGGRFDGALGVLAALEALRTVQEAGLALPVNLEAIDFSDEEGTLVGLLGSAALAGSLSPADLDSPRGGRTALLEGLARAGLDEGELFSALRPPDSLAGYLELHIEQGPRLWRAGVDIGVVSAIVGIASYRLAFLGRADHAGTTPMQDRRDAAQGAAAFTLAARQIVMVEFPECAVNIGRLTLSPGAFNIVPARADLALEFRAPDEHSFNLLKAALLDQARAEASRYGLELEVEPLGEHPPAPMSLVAQDAIRAAARDLGLSFISLTSGAGHDAQSLAPLCPAGMLFVPSVEGASHSPREFTEWQACLNGANTLLGAALHMVSGLR